MVLDTTTLARRCRRGASTPSLENHDLRGWPAPERHRRAFVLDGPINREAFDTYVEEVLVPEIRPDDMMDNLSIHKGPQVRAMLEAAGPILL